ncbi:hypothetical protein HYV12_04265 [Candidatus Dojkabacteria bacterium]|nr:hypothetical protein [Candidatus Dojkabacteria bacterium]
MNAIYWFVVILGYILATISLLYVYVIAISFLNETPFVSLERKAIKFALSLLDLKKGDSFIDIGSGDGKVVLLAAEMYKEFGSYNGVEYSKPLVMISNIRRIFSKSKYSIKFHHKDALKYDYRKYNKVFMYLTTPLATSVTELLLKQLKPGSVIVSVYFPVEIKNIKIEEKKYRIGGKIKSFYIITIP